MTTILRFILFFLLAPVFAIVAQAAESVQGNFRIVDTRFQSETTIQDGLSSSQRNYDSSGARSQQRRSLDSKGSDDDGLKRIGELEAKLAVGPFISFSAELVAARGPVVIGETMARVEQAAAKIPGSKILNDMPDFRSMGMNADQVTSSMMQYNRKWILEQMRSGRQIIDIGADANRATPSIFYQMEQNMLKNYQKLHPEFSGAVSP